MAHLIEPGETVVVTDWNRLCHEAINNAEILVLGIAETPLEPNERNRRIHNVLHDLYWQGYQARVDYAGAQTECVCAEDAPEPGFRAISSRLIPGGKISPFK